MSVLIPALPEGATLGLIAPAGPPAAGQLEQVPALLARHGYRAKIFPGCSGPAQFGFLAATDEQRLADLHAALADPEVDAVMALRGGYGCARLMGRIDVDLVKRHPKPLIGYSDITTLHGLRDSLGIPSWHGPMPTSDLLHSEADAATLFAQLRHGAHTGDVLAPAMDEHPLSRGVSAQGRLVGGNLSVYVTLLGTEWQPRAEQIEGGILFLEDVGEAPYRVDRMLAQLRQAGVLDAAAGFVLGSFSDADSPDEVLADYLHRLNKPVLAGWPSGHCSPNAALPMGVEVTLDVAGRRLILG